MLLTTTNNNLFDTFFSDPWFNDPWYDDRDVQNAQKKLYGHNGKASFKHGILRLDIPKKQPKPQVEEKKCISIEG